MMLTFFANNWVSILLSLVTAGALAFCRWTWKQIKNYQQLLEEKQEKEMDVHIDEKLTPVVEEIEDLRSYIRTLDIEDTKKFNLIIASYRFRLVQLCRMYIAQGYMTQEQYEQLNEFFNLYQSLGGNGAAKDYYDRAMKLPIV